MNGGKTENNEREMNVVVHDPFSIIQKQLLLINSKMNVNDQKHIDTEHDKDDHEEDVDNDIDLEDGEIIDDGNDVEECEEGSEEGAIYPDSDDDIILDINKSLITPGNEIYNHNGKILDAESETETESESESESDEESEDEDEENGVIMIDGHIVGVGNTPFLHLQSRKTQETKQQTEEHEDGEIEDEQIAEKENGDRKQIQQNDEVDVYVQNGSKHNQTGPDSKEVGIGIIEHEDMEHEDEDEDEEEEDDDNAKISKMNDDEFIAHLAQDAFMKQKLKWKSNEATLVNDNIMLEIMQTDAMITNEEEDKKKKQKEEELRIQREKEAMEMYNKLKEEEKAERILEIENAKNKMNKIKKNLKFELKPTDVAQLNDTFTMPYYG